MNNQIPDLHPPSSRRRGIQLCMPFEEKRLLKWHLTDVLVQPKLDGERCRALITQQGVQLLSSEENEIISVPHINEQLQWLCQHWDLSEIELDGELYSTGMEFSEIHSRVSRKENIHDNYSEIKFHVFDIVNSERQLTRIEQLIDMFNNYVATDVQLINSKLIPATVPDIMKLLSHFTEEGNEGIIIRHPFARYERKRSLYVMKWKPKKNDIYRIITCQQEQTQDGQLKDSLGALICIGEDGTTFGVGSGFTAAQRKDLWQRRHEMPGMFVEVAYQALTPKRVPRFPIFCRLIESPFNG